MKGYRTLAVNLVIAILGVLGTTVWGDVLPPGDAWMGVAIVGAVNIALRFITTTAVGQSS